MQSSPLPKFSPDRGCFASKVFPFRVAPSQKPNNPNLNDNISFGITELTVDLIFYLVARVKPLL